MLESPSFALLFWFAKYFTGLPLVLHWFQNCSSANKKTDPKSTCNVQTGSLGHIIRHRESTISHWSSCLAFRRQANIWLQRLPLIKYTTLFHKLPDGHYKPASLWITSLIFAKQAYKTAYQELFAKAPIILLLRQYQGGHYFTKQVNHHALNGL